MLQQRLLLDQCQLYSALLLAVQLKPLHHKGNTTVWYHQCLHIKYTPLCAETGDRALKTLGMIQATWSITI